MLPQVIVSDQDVAAFRVYAQREVSLDVSARHAETEQGRESIAALRALNRKILLRESRRGGLEAAVPPSTPPAPAKTAAASTEPSVPPDLTLEIRGEEAFHVLRALEARAEELQRDPDAFNRRSGDLITAAAQRLRRSLGR